jgi:hypothetical protein
MRFNVVPLEWDAAICAYKSPVSISIGVDRLLKAPVQRSFGFNCEGTFGG